MFPIETTTLRSRAWLPLIPFLFAAIPFILFNHKFTNTELSIGIGVFAVVTLMSYVLTKAEIIIDNDCFTYKILFVKQEIFWNSVAKTYLRYHHDGNGGRNTWYFQSLSGRKAKLRTKLFSRKSLRIMAEAVVAKCSNAEIEQRITNMAEGHFPWYIW